MARGLRGAAVALAFLAVLASASATGYPSSCTTLLSVIKSTPSLSKVAAAIDAAALNLIFNDPNGVYTFFAPNNDAVAAAGSWWNDVSLVKKSLWGSIVPGVAATSTKLIASNGVVLQTVDVDISLTVNIAMGKVLIKGPYSVSTVVTADITGCKAILHIVDTVVVPTASCKPASPPPTGYSFPSPPPPATYSFSPPPSPSPSPPPPVYTYSPPPPPVYTYSPPPPCASPPPPPPPPVYSYSPPPPPPVQVSSPPVYAYSPPPPCASSPPPPPPPVMVSSPPTYTYSPPPPACASPPPPPPPPVKLSAPPPCKPKASPPPPPPKIRCGYSWCSHGKKCFSKKYGKGKYGWTAYSCAKSCPRGYKPYKHNYGL